LSFPEPGHGLLADDASTLDNRAVGAGKSRATLDGATEWLLTDMVTEPR